MPDQLPLFGEPTTDDVARMTAKNADERAWEREVRRRTGGTVERPIPDAPCCARCANWAAPEGGERFGACRVLAAIHPGSRYAFDVVAVSTAEEVGAPWVHLSTKPWYAGCLAYEERPT